jgi:hypothetical protein
MMPILLLNWIHGGGCCPQLQQRLPSNRVAGQPAQRHPVAHIGGEPLICQEF